jgi:hypothetical protein
MKVIITPLLLLAVMLTGAGCGSRTKTGEPTWNSIQFQCITKTTTPAMGERIERMIVFQNRDGLKLQEEGDSILLISNGIKHRYNRADQSPVLRTLESAEHWRAVNYREQIEAQVVEIENKWKREGEEVVGGEHCIRYAKQGKTGWWQAPVC